MVLLALGATPVDGLRRLRDPGLGLHGLGAYRVQAGARRMGEGEVGIGCGCLLQDLRRARPGREKEVDTLPVALGRAVRSGREQQAAVVKAGVYLLLRFSAIFGTNPTWNVILVVFGLGTALMSALFAITKTDLKHLTAYSTVSHLGWIVAAVGVGTPAAFAAALVHTLAHALFKSALFMLVGVSILVPLILGYTGWAYWVFRGKVKAGSGYH